MAFNPLNPEWPKQTADTIDRVVQTIRGAFTTRAVKATNALVFGLIAAFAGVVAAIISVIVGIRALQAYLTWDFGTTAAWLVGIVALLGLLVVLVGTIRSQKATLAAGFVVLVCTGGRWALHEGHSRISHVRSVWISYLVVGGLLLFVGSLLMAKRHSPVES